MICGDKAGAGRVCGACQAYNRKGGDRKREEGCAALKAKDGLLVALEDEQGNELLPGGGCLGLEEDAVAMKDEFAGGSGLTDIGEKEQELLFLSYGNIEGGEV